MGCAAQISHDQISKQSQYIRNQLVAPSLQEEPLMVEIPDAEYIAFIESQNLLELKRHLPFKACKYYNGKTALMIAAEKGLEISVQFFAQYEQRLQTEHGDTASLLAIDKNQYDVLEYMQREILIKNLFGINALEACKRKGHITRTGKSPVNETVNQETSVDDFKEPSDW
ncbi:Ankyrin_repeat protein 1 [Hexamita inflata]|uniref:Ankyrin repeat protein 1 n=1 Tax=Hexamita inflata TaxID=28002 RepID=A0AA86QIF2_9EUKA|nr:Ankyrin repeat protein 1 [Hexamita inflata]